MILAAVTCQPRAENAAGTAAEGKHVRLLAVGNSFVPNGLTAEDVAILQRIAHQTVSGGVKPPLPAPATPVPTAPGG